MKHLRVVAILLTVTGCAPAAPAASPSDAAAFAKQEHEYADRTIAAGIARDAKVAEARAAQEHQAARTREAREQQLAILDLQKANAFTCAADRECAARPVCQARADLAEAREAVAAIQTKRARFGVIDLHALSEAADEVIRLEGELAQARSTYRAAFATDAVCQ